MSTKTNMQHCHLGLKFSSVASQQQQRLTGPTLRGSSSSSITCPLSVMHKATVLKVIALPKGQDHQAKTSFFFFFWSGKNLWSQKPRIWETVGGVPDWEQTRQTLTNYLSFLLFSDQVWFICWFYPVIYVLSFRQFILWDRNHHLLFLKITMLDNLTEVFHLLYCVCVRLITILANSNSHLAPFGLL